MKKDLKAILKVHKNKFGKVVPFDLNHGNVVVFDFTESNRELDQVDLDNEDSFTSYIFNKLDDHNSPVGIGGYGEERVIYKRSQVFTAVEVRSIHLGIDIWAHAGTPVFAPIDGTIHSFKNNKAHGDYGPTIITRHELEGCEFYLLYGHLSKGSLENLKNGQEIKQGMLIGKFGKYEENVHWPPHLHFQIIQDIGQHFGDYPGVAPPSKRESFLEQCPDPNLILGARKLERD